MNQSNSKKSHKKKAGEKSAFPLGYNLIRGDATERLAAMPGDSVDVVVTSPPYNLGVDYLSYSDDMTEVEYIAWCISWMSEVKRVMKDDASFFLNIGSSPSNQVMPLRVALAATGLFSLQNTFHWIKSISVEENGETISVGHFKPINSQRFVNNNHEFIFHFTKSGKVKLDRLSLGVPYKHKSNVTRWAGSKGVDKRCRGNVWYVPYPTINSRESQRPHPATFPPQLVRNCLNIHGVNPGLHVLDPFLGLGFSAIAAWEEGVQQFTGYDIESDYVEYARGALSERIREKELLEKNQHSRLRLEDEAKGILYQKIPPA